MQISFTDTEYTQKKKRTRRARFLDDLARITPWSALIAALEPHQQFQI